MSILELGCGWGSLTLWLAKQYPESQITAVSNSSSQRDYITAEAIRRKLLKDRKVDGKPLVADVLTKHVDAQTLERHLPNMGLGSWERLGANYELAKLRQINTLKDIKPIGSLNSS